MRSDISAMCQIYKSHDGAEIKKKLIFSEQGVRYEGK